MRYSTITNNIIKSAKISSNKEETLNILYNSYSPVFDSILKECQSFNLIDDTLSDKDKELFSYNLYWCNNPLNYLDRRDHIKFQHLKDIAFFHEFPESNIKKEDKFLLQNSLENCIKVCPNTDIQKSWGLNSAYEIQYGLPEANLSKGKDIRPRKSVILIDHNDSHQVKLLARYLQQQFPDCLIFKPNNSSWQDISSTLNEYKICIVFNSYIDILAALSCSCQVISPLSLDEQYVATTTDFSNIIETVMSLIGSYNISDATDHSVMIQNKYSFVGFQQKLQGLLRQISKEPFIL